MSKDSSAFEFMLVEKNSFMEWVNSFARCGKCGKKMNVKIEKEMGMAKQFADECRQCTEKNTWFLTGKGAKTRFSNDAVEATYGKYSCDI